jgi:hypothetical protein
MVGHVRATAGDPGDDRLARASAMVNDAVALLLKAMEEIKGEGGHGDDRDAAGSPDRNDQQPGGSG